jgi:hypothetical protein
VVGVETAVGEIGVGSSGIVVQTPHPITNGTTNATPITRRNNRQLIFFSFRCGNQPPNLSFSSASPGQTAKEHHQPFLLRKT